MACIHCRKKFHSLNFFNCYVSHSQIYTYLLPESLSIDLSVCLNCFLSLYTWISNKKLNLSIINTVTVWLPCPRICPLFQAFFILVTRTAIYSVAQTTDFRVIFDSSFSHIPMSNPSENPIGYNFKIYLGPKTFLIISMVTISIYATISPTWAMATVS